MKNTMTEMFVAMLLVMIVAIVLQVIIGTLTFPLDQLLQEVHMDELYNYCSKCESVKLNYAQMLQQDKPKFCEAVHVIVMQYPDGQNCINTWYEMTLDVTRLIKQMGYCYHLELDNKVLVIEVCKTSIVQLGQIVVL